MKIKSLFLILLASLLINCTKDQENIETPVVSLTALTLIDVSYGSNTQQKFDLYLPANRTKAKTKTLILVHGGGWIEGDKANMDYIIPIVKQYLPEYAVANMNYRLATTGSFAFPKQIDDVNSVIGALKNGNYGISDDFGFIGVSAGAHLSMLYSYGYNPNIKMVCSIVGPTNFIDENYTSNPTMISLFQNATGITYSPNNIFFKEISPLFKASINAQPTILVYGNSDPLIPITQGQSMHNKLDQLGVYNEYHVYNGGHGDWVINDQVDAYNKIVAFIKNKF
jgi:acetyl esterase/lipase